MQFKDLYEDLMDHQKTLIEATDTKSIIKALVDTSFGGDNESQMKAVQLLKGLATSDDPAANAFMKKLDTWTSGYKMNEKVDLEESYTSNELDSLSADKTINAQLRDFDGNKTKWLGMNDSEALKAFQKFINKRLKNVAKIK